MMLRGRGATPAASHGHVPDLQGACITVEGRWGFCHRFEISPREGKFSYLCEICSPRLSRGAAQKCHKR